MDSWVGKIPCRRDRLPLQYSWASLVAQLVKNPSAMRETWIRSLGWEDPLEKGLATHPRILAWRIPWTEESWRAVLPGVTKSQTPLSTAPELAKGDKNARIRVCVDAFVMMGQSLPSKSLHLCLSNGYQIKWVPVIPEGTQSHWSILRKLSF